MLTAGSPSQSPETPDILASRGAVGLPQSRAGLPSLPVPQAGSLLVGTAGTCMSIIHKPRAHCCVASLSLQVMWTLHSEDNERSRSSAGSQDAGRKARSVSRLV